MALRQGNAGGSVLRGQTLTFIQTSIVCQPRCDFLALAPEAAQKQQTAEAPGEPGAETSISDTNSHRHEDALYRKLTHCLKGAAARHAPGLLLFIESSRCTESSVISNMCQNKGHSPCPSKGTFGYCCASRTDKDENECSSDTKEHLC